MIKIGMKIGKDERYEILEKIGTGGMSDVYKGKDHKLNRFVAVKVLKQEFSENANFVSKFRIEAQAAAGLMHPNIVNVYDVDDENDIYYIVMELVEGITLKKYIEKKARLSYKEAVSIAIQVSMGIEAAHNNHIIHRDIKPQNIIISKDGKVKVTDFGIAKAATSNTITSNVMGSVHYTSPEQARGGYSDEKSDIYSLGITMFEMLTGRVPFNGETTVAIAIKNIQEELPSPAEYVTEIPGSVESIVIKCCQKSPDRRYQNVQELIADLKQSLMNPDEDFVIQNDPDMDGGTRMISDNDMAQIKRRTTYQEYEEQESMRLLSDTEALYEDSVETEEDEEYDYNPRMERVTTLLAILAGIVICAFVIFFAVTKFRDREQDQGRASAGPIYSDDLDETASPEPSTVPMPSVVKKTKQEAEAILKELGLEPKVQYEESGTVPEGVVMNTDVEVGTVLPKGSTVTLTVSAGSIGIEVPKVTGESYEEAERILRAQGFEVIRGEDVYVENVEKGIVVYQMPSALSKAPSGAIITLTVSQGRVSVPDLIGKTEMDGTVELLELKLVPDVMVREYSTVYEEGVIFYQSYSPKSMVPPGTKVQLKVSMGPAPTPTPTPTPTLTPTPTPTPTQTPAPVTYKYNKSISAPTEAEAPEYDPQLVSKVSIRILADDGTELMNSEVTSFPYSVNFSGIKSPTGTLTMTFTVQELVTNPGAAPDGPVGETTSRVVTVTRKLEFERE